MKNTISSLLYRLLRTKTLWILLIIAVALPFISAVTLSAAEGLMENMSGMFGLEINGIGVDVLTLAGAEVSLAGDAALLTIIGVAIIIASEFSYGTVHNSLVSGKSRTKVFFGYAVISAVISVIITTVYCTCNFLFNFAFLGNGGYTPSALANGFFVSYALAIIMTLFSAMVTLLFTVTTQKKSMAILLPILVCSLLPGILTTITSVALLTGDLSMEVASWLPIVNISVFNATDIDGALVLKIVLMTVILVAAATAGAWAIFRRKDIK